MDAVHKRIISVLLCILLVFSLSGCGGSKVNSFTWFVDKIPTNLDPQIAVDSADVIACTHLYSGLFRKAVDGSIVNACCESYTLSPDRLTYTFTLLSGLKYVSARGAETEYSVTAQDFLFAFHRVFDAATASPYAGSFAAIENSSAVLAGSADASALGVSAPDDHTLVIRLSAPDDNFLEKLTLPGAVPCNEAFFNSTKSSYGLNKNAVLSNGAFYLFNWTSTGLFLRRAADDDFINNLRLVQNTDASGLSNEALVENEKCTAILDAEADETALNAISYSDTTWCLVFNAGSVFSNPSLRAALAADAQDAALPENTLYAAVDGILPDDLSVDGYSYRDTMGSAVYRPGDPKSSYQQALAAVGADSLKGLRILVPESADAAYVQSINSLWQEHYSLFFSIETVDDETFAERFSSGDYSFAFAPLSLSQSDPLSLLSPFADTSLYANYGYADLLRQAADTSGKARCEALFRAEYQLTSDCEVVPLFAQEKRLLVDPAVSGLRFDPYGPLVDVTDAHKKK